MSIGILQEYMGGLLNELIPDPHVLQTEGSQIGDHRLSTSWVIIGAMTLLPLDEAIASRAVFVIVSGSDGRTDGRAETLLEPAE